MTIESGADITGLFKIGRVVAETLALMQDRLRPGMTTREEDSVEQLYSAGSLDHVLFFTDQGKVYAQRAYAIAEAGRGDDPDH